MYYERWRDPTAVMGRRIVAFVIDILVIGVLVSIFFRPSVSTEQGVISCASVEL